MAMNLARTHQLEQLTGVQKAAILCMVLGSESAAMITQKLGQDEVEQISFEIARMDRVSPEATDAVLAEWIEIMMAADSIAAHGRSRPFRSLEPIPSDPVLGNEGFRFEPRLGEHQTCAQSQP